MVDSEGANKMMELLRHTADNGSLVDKTLTGGSGQDQKTYQVKSMDDFSYKDPIDGSVSKKQVAYKVDTMLLYGRERRGKQVEAGKPHVGMVKK